MVRDDIIDKVKARIDELSPFTSEELNPTSTLIDALLDDSTRALLLMLPVHMIKPYEVPNYYTHIEYQNGSGQIELPDEFLRLHTFKMATWKHEVNTAITPDDPKYKLQSNKYTMGKENKPVVVIKNGVSVKHLYYYSVDPDLQIRTIETFWYIPVISSTELNDDLIIPLSWLCAADVLQVLNEGEASKQARAQLQNYIISANQ